MGTLYIAVILLCRVAQHLYGKKTSLMVEGIPELLRYNGIRQCISAVLALALVLYGGNGLKTDMTTVILSLFSGVMLACSMSFSLYAMKTGVSCCTVRNGRNDYSVSCRCVFV